MSLVVVVGIGIGIVIIVVVFVVFCGLRGGVSPARNNTHASTNCEVRFYIGVYRRADVVHASQQRHAFTFTHALFEPIIFIDTPHKHTETVGA